MANIFQFNYIGGVEYLFGSRWVTGAEGMFGVDNYSLGDGTVNSGSDDGVLNWGDAVYLTGTGLIGPFTYISGTNLPAAPGFHDPITVMVVRDADTGIYYLLTDNADYGNVDRINGDPDTGVGTESAAFQYFYDINVLDAWQGNALDNFALGLAGNDSLDGGDGNDTLDGGAENDTLIGGAGADALVGGTGNDTYILGNDTTDTLIENSGEGTDAILLSYISYTLTAANVENLTLTGGEGGSYTVTGNASDNVITALIDDGSATFVFNGGDGHDTLNGAAFSDTLNGGVGRDVLNGGSGDDSLLGGGSNDIITGGDGNDYLDGGNSSDKLFGNAGRDTLHGGASNDTLTGAGGRDVFLFDADLAANGIDTITDFLVGTDLVYVAVAVSGLGYTGYLNAANFVSGAAATTSDQHFIYDSGNLYYDADGSGAGAQVQFATFSNAAVLSASDIVIV